MKFDMKTKDLQQENIIKIQQLFPEVITETKDKDDNVKKGIDFDKLKQLLSDYIVEGVRERYGLNWVGKKESILNANLTTTKTLRPKKEESVDFENTKNIYIEGDNLEVLKIIQESYLGKIKMIYIDPPYNTGNDFIYKDDFKKSRKDYEKESEILDEEGNKLVQNLESNGRFHSDWLSMMYSRLKLARNLLRDDGVIFISIDDNEVHNLRHICDEIFGEENFINTFIWINNPSGRQIKNVGAAVTKEYIISYCKNINYIKPFVISALDAKEIMPDIYKGFEHSIKKDNKGYYIITHELANINSQFNEKTRPNLVFEIFYNPNNKDVIFGDLGDPAPEGYVKISPVKIKNNNISKYYAWRWSKEKILKEKDNLEFINIKGKWKIFTKRRDFNYTMLKDVITNINTKQGSDELKRIKMFKTFDYPKPISLIKIILKTLLDQNDIILDFFSGSATTAHAVMELNAEDGGNRQFIMVQLDEKTDEKSEAYKAGYKTIPEIGRERIRRAGKKIKDEFLEKYEKELEKLKEEENKLIQDEETQEKIKELEEKIENIKNLDTGFRTFKVDSSNMKDIYYTPEELTQGNLSLFESKIKEDRTDEDLLIQIILDLGLKLDLKIEEKNINNNKIYIVEDNLLVAYFGQNIEKNLIEKIKEIKPLRVVFDEKAFKSDSTIINLEEEFKKELPDTEFVVF
jgi:adenine-specific DNA-methyltransferase